MHFIVADEGLKAISFHVLVSYCIDQQAPADSLSQNRSNYFTLYIVPGHLANCNHFATKTFSSFNNGSYFMIYVQSCWVIFHDFFVVCRYFSKSTFSKNSFRITSRVKRFESRSGSMSKLFAKVISR